MQVLHQPWSDEQKEVKKMYFLLKQIMPQMEKLAHIT